MELADNQQQYPHHTQNGPTDQQGYSQAEWNYAQQYNGAHQPRPDVNNYWYQTQPSVPSSWETTGYYQHNQQNQGQWPALPSPEAQRSIARAEHWVVNQPNTPAPPIGVPTIGSPPPKTQVSDSDTETGYPFPPTSRTRTTRKAARGKRKDRICGLKRSVFLVILAIGMFILVVGVATGLGVGLALSRNNSSSPTGTKDGAAGAMTTTTSSKKTSSTTKSTTTSRVSAVSNGPLEASTTATASTTGTATITTTATGSAATASYTGTVVPGPIYCPANNNTVYLSEDTQKPFNIECGRDYNSNNGAKDIGSILTTTMAECIDACGTNSKCVGVGFGNYKGNWTCWMKGALGTPNWDATWYFARLQDLKS